VVSLRAAKLAAGSALRHSGKVAANQRRLNR